MKKFQPDVSPGICLFFSSFLFFFGGGAEPHLIMYVFNKKLEQFLRISYMNTMFISFPPFPQPLQILLCHPILSQVHDFV